MEQAGTASRPPLMLTAHKPVDIIGKGNMDLFTDHMRICFNENNGEFPEKKLKREFTRAERTAIGETLDELAEHGFYAMGIKSNGQILWGIVTKKNEYDIFNEGLSELQKMSREELSELARNGYRKIRDNQDVEPVQQWQKDFEGV